MKNKSLQSRTAAKTRYLANKWAKENSQTDEPERASSSGRPAQDQEDCAEEFFTPVEDIDDEESIKSIKCIEDEESSEAIEWIEKPQENIECLDDSEPGSLNNIEQGASAGRIHERLDVVVDSGASANALPVGWCNHVPTFPLGTEEKAIYRTANGGIVRAIGKKSIYGETTTGATVGLNFTEMEVHRPLASVSKMVRAGNIVVFGDPKGGNYVKNIATGLRHQLVEKMVFISSLSGLRQEVVAQQPMATCTWQQRAKPREAHPHLREARRVFAGRPGGRKP